jgi:hypothetical protein
MPTVELTVEQIVDAVRQLPEKDRQYVMTRLISGEIPKGEEAILRFQRLGSQFRMTPKQEQRLSELLAKGGERSLTKSDQRELDVLLDLSHQRTMELALAVMSSGDRLQGNRGVHRGKSHQ